jgi:hypothetical protein
MSHIDGTGHVVSFVETDNARKALKAALTALSQNGTMAFKKEDDSRRGAEPRR